ncbi:hypothetical protein POJ06DRAFT_239951 [Lipomyces tetrasporus]|uniref:Mug135-like C-terminal domain-containing protein n=1 Tax=Lipomyces tetrasporus TaxID=54092 RepID=A0AAD7QMT0_9ASCO|nr:uncharacterized protein POJ06DRAFT_239951 [Lipomyces tetrasporus]KAJ8098225.1 hypothetical protein POJ06DRAFT_239951 [Lipomyces tetrasporus]
MLAEEPIVRPQLRASVQQVVPAQPEEPPTDQDLAAARSYYDYLSWREFLKFNDFEEGGLSDDKRPSQQEVADAISYLDNVKERVRVAHGDPLQQVLREIRESMRRLEEGKTDMSPRLDSVARAQNLPLIGPRRAENRAANGVGMLFWVVPFNDGSMTTDHPHNLPPLHTLANINNLNMARLRAYCAGYGFDVGNQAQMRTNIRKAIGKQE